MKENTNMHTVSPIANILMKCFLNVINMKFEFSGFFLHAYDMLQFLFVSFLHYYAS